MGGVQKNIYPKIVEQGIRIGDLILVANFKLELVFLLEKLDAGSIGKV